MKTKKPTKKKPAAVQRTTAGIQIKAEAVDELFTEVIAGMMALQAVWELLKSSTEDQQ